jgi:hypothetical protein
MLNELKNVFYVIVIFVFIFFTTKYYVSDDNKKKSHKSISGLNKKINKYTKNIPILKSDTDNIIEYVENTGINNKKKYKFWKLLIIDEK